MNISVISAEELDGIINNEKFIIVDVRDAGEYRKNHIPGAVNISMDQIRQAQFDKEKIIVLYCEHGGNSMVAARELARRGFRVKTVVGGIKAYMGRH
ncbi:MAG: rhodanese-like domain-containing protein [Alistipes sp.]|nr:rhodanese-like domain-containing protein [Alistipes sp.]